MSPVARMMAIADIFEALTAARPAVQEGARSCRKRIEIMALMSKDQHIDPELFELFLTSGVYREYAERFLLPEQIDEVDVAEIPQRLPPKRASRGVGPRGSATLRCGSAATGSRA